MDKVVLKRIGFFSDKRKRTKTDWNHLLVSHLSNILGLVPRVATRFYCSRFTFCLLRAPNYEIWQVFSKNSHLKWPFLRARLDVVLHLQNN